MDWTVNAVDSNLFSTAGESYASHIRQNLWMVVNEEISVGECEIYRYEVYFNEMGSVGEGRQEYM